MVRGDLPVMPLDDATQSLLEPFDSYVAGGTVELPGLGATTVISVHASPQPVTDADLARWHGELPAPRTGGSGVRDAGKLFYSDLIVDVLRQMAAGGPVLATGDLNEARAWDDHHVGHTWGAEFFALVEAAGLRDVTHGLWGEERPTRYHAEQQAYQLDFVLATEDVSRAIVHAEVDAAWLAPDVDLARVSDHAPVWFELALAP